MSDEVITEAPEEKAQEEKFVKIIHDVKDKLDRMEKQQGIDSKEVMKKAEWGTFQEKYEADFDAIDKKLKEIKIASTFKAEEKDVDVKSFVKLVRHQALTRAAEMGEKVHNIKLFEPTEAESKKMLIESKTLDTRVANRAGYLVVPPEYRMQIINQNAQEFSPIRGEATVDQTSSNQVEIPTQLTHGVCGWVAQQGTRSKDETPTWGMEKIPLHMAYAYYASSIEQLDDSAFNLEEKLRNTYSIGMNVLEGTGFVSGSGIGTPEGFLTNADVANTVSGHATQVTADGLINLQNAQKEPYWNGAKWYMKRATRGAIALLKDGIGNYIFPDMAYNQSKMLLDSPIVFTADMPTIGAGTYPVLWGNMKMAYNIIDKNVSTMMIKDIYSSKTTGVVEFLMHWRVGGQTILPESIRKLKIAAA